MSPITLDSDAFQEILNNLNQGVGLFDFEFHLVLYNRKFTEHQGIPLELVKAILTSIYETFYLCYLCLLYGHPMATLG